MSEVKRYECTVLIDASCGVTVEASSPEEAAELAENAAAEQGAGSLCHQCSSHTECGDSYAVIVYDEAGDEVLDTDYRSGQLKAVQSELTALREELAKSKKETMYKHAALEAKAKALTAAEQRNESLEDLLRRAKEWIASADCNVLTLAIDVFSGEIGDNAERLQVYSHQLLDDMRTALGIKPTESGASE